MFPLASIISPEKTGRHFRNWNSIPPINLNSSEKEAVEGRFEKSQTSDSFTARRQRACATVAPLSPNPFLVACFVHDAWTLKGVWELFYRLIQVITHLSQVEGREDSGAFQL